MREEACTYRCMLAMPTGSPDVNMYAEAYGLSILEEFIDVQSFTM